MDTKVAEKEMSTGEGGIRLRVKAKESFQLAVFGFVRSLPYVAILFLALHLYIQHDLYADAIENLGKSPGESSAVLSLGFARALDQAMLRSGVAFFGFVLVFVGAMFVLAAAESAFRFEMESTVAKRVLLETSSPGLVMTVLGVVLTAFALFAGRQIEFSSVSNPSPSLAGLALTAEPPRTSGVRLKHYMATEDSPPVAVFGENPDYAAIASGLSENSEFLAAFRQLRPGATPPEAAEIESFLRDADELKRRLHFLSVERQPFDERADG